MISRLLLSNAAALSFVGTLKKMVSFRTLSILLVFGTAVVFSRGLSIRRGPTDRTLLRGGMVRLICVFENLQYSSQIMWYRSNGDMISDGRLVIASREAGGYTITGDRRRGEYNLEITNVQVGDTDEYSCGYTEGNGDIQSRSATLTVQAPPDSGYPTCTVTPPDPRIGDRMEMICRSVGGVPSAALTWNKDGVPVTPVKTDMSIWIKLFRKEDVGGTFICIANSTVEDSPRTCEIRLAQEPPTVSISPESIVCSVGDEVEVTCTRNDKTSDTDFVWYYNGVRSEKLQDRGRFQVINGGRTLRITKVKRKDANALIKCRLEIYDGFLKHATAPMAVQITDPDYFPGRFTSRSPTNEFPRYMNTTYDPVMRETNDEYPESGSSGFFGSPLIIIVIFICICFMLIVVLGLLYLKRVRNPKVNGRENENAVQINGHVSARSRHVYETAITLIPGERGAVVPVAEPATYHDIDEESPNMQIRYHDNPTLSSNQQRVEPPTSSGLRSERLYEIPYTDVPSVPRKVSASASEYVEIANNNGKACCVNPPRDHDPQRGLKKNRKAIDWPPAEKVPNHLPLRPSRSEPDLIEKPDVKALARLINENSSLNDINVRKDKLGKPEQNKERRISPTSPPPNTIVPRPNQLQTKGQKRLTPPDLNSMGDIQHMKVRTSDDIKPKVALKPLISPNRRTPSPGSPVVPPRRWPMSDPKTVDEEGYVIPKSKSTLPMDNQTHDPDSYEYEQVDQVDRFFPDKKSKCKNDEFGNKPGQRIKANSSPSSSSPVTEYRELDRSSVEWNSYQPLSPGLPEASKHSMKHEYDDPPTSIPKVKKQSLEKSDYLEILD